MLSLLASAGTMTEAEIGNFHPSVAPQYADIAHAVQFVVTALCRPFLLRSSLAFPYRMTITNRYQYQDRYNLTRDY